MLIKNIYKNMKILICGIHYFSAEVKTKIDVIPRGCFIIQITQNILNAAVPAYLSKPD